MAIVLKKNTGINTDGVLVGIWAIKEDMNNLVTLLSPLAEDDMIFTKFKSNNRKCQWLGVRCLVNELLDTKVQIVYNSNGMPFLKNMPFNISISHSKDMAVVILSKTHSVGIDIENISDRVLKIAHKFMNPRELRTISAEDKVFHLGLCWSAKETIYKITGGKYPDFKKIVLSPFAPAPTGQINATVRSGKLIENYLLNYFTFENNIVVWGSFGK